MYPQPSSSPLDYESQHYPQLRKTLPCKLLGLAVLALSIGQFIWFFAYAILIRGIYPDDGDYKRPLQDFFIYLSVAVPSLAILFVTAFRCRIEYRDRASLRGCIGSIIASVLAAIFIGITIHGWVIDDIVNFNKTR